jgi:2-keto-3-deoxy-L-rhamnonate aldolase RhmA
VGRLSYVPAANANIIVGVQIETALGLQNAAEIAKVEGIGEWCAKPHKATICSRWAESIVCTRQDLIFIGPVDLAMSLGAPRPFPKPDPSFEAKVQDVKRIAHAAGKKV